MNNPARGDDNWPIELSQWPLWRGILSQISHLIIRQWRAGSDGEPRGRKNARNSFYSSGWRWAEEGMEQGVPQTFGLFPTSNHIHLQEWGSSSGHSLHCWIRSTENSVPIYGGLVFPKFSNLPELGMLSFIFTGVETLVRRWGMSRVIQSILSPVQVAAGSMRNIPKMCLLPFTNSPKMQWKFLNLEKYFID